MTKEQFLDAVGDIDDKFVKKMTNVLDVPQGNYLINEEPQAICLTSGHIPFWKIAFSTVAAICILTTGIYTVVKLHVIHSAISNDSH